MKPNLQKIEINLSQKLHHLSEFFNVNNMCQLKKLHLWLINKDQLCSFTDYFIKNTGVIYVSDFSSIQENI